MSYADWGWMLPTVQGSTILASPVLAGATAYAVIKEWGPGVRTSLEGVARPGRPLADIVMALTLMALTAQGGWLLIGSAPSSALNAPATGITMPWHVLTGPSALVAGIGLGCLVGVV